MESAGTSSLIRKVEGSNTLKDCYYVQQISDQLFLVRERMVGSPNTLVNERTRRLSTTRFDAYEYADTMNKKVVPSSVQKD